MKLITPDVVLRDGGFSGKGNAKGNATLQLSRRHTIGVEGLRVLWAGLSV